MVYDWSHIIGFVVGVLVVAFILAWRQKREGLPFWRAFIMSILAATGIGLIVVKLLAN